MNISSHRQQHALFRRTCAPNRFKPSPVSINTRSRLPVIPRVASNSAEAVSSFTQTVTGDATAAAACPFTALKNQLTAASRVVQQKQQQRSSADVAVPGPAPFSLESLSDVATIFFQGLHVAMLAFNQKYGPVCRYINPHWARAVLVFCHFMKLCRCSSLTAVVFRQPLPC